ncbi:MAG TPA: hypothetical protein VKR30_10425 [Candidatus Limnocylindrales bacterium]|nr:hypothetical protein [Candidatus Limnocylindrales bacterium]
MNDLGTIRREIAADLTATTERESVADDGTLDAVLRLLSRSWQPSALAIEALTADAPQLEYPSEHEERDRQRRLEVLRAFRAVTPTIGTLLRTRRGAAAARTLADQAGVAPAVWALIEEDRAPSAILNIDPHRLRRVAFGLGIPRKAVVAALERSLAEASAGHYAFGHRPRQPVDESEPLSFEAIDETERVWAWVIDFLAEEG